MLKPLERLKHLLHVLASQLEIAFYIFVRLIEKDQKHDPH